jgi:hypothetical protein
MFMIIKYPRNKPFTTDQNHAVPITPIHHGYLNNNHNKTNQNDKIKKNVVYNTNNTNNKQKLRNSDKQF